MVAQPEENRKILFFITDLGNSLVTASKCAARKYKKKKEKCAT